MRDKAETKEKAKIFIIAAEYGERSKSEAAERNREWDEADTKEKP